MWIGVLVLLILSPAIFWGVEGFRQWRLKKERQADNIETFRTAVNAQFPNIPEELINRIHESVCSLTSFRVPPRLSDDLRLFGVGTFMGYSLDEVLELIAEKNPGLHEATMLGFATQKAFPIRVVDLVEFLANALAEIRMTNAKRSDTRS